MTPIRMLFLIDKLVAAGTQTNVLEIVKRLDRTKFEPHVIALLGGGELEGEFQSAGIEPVILNVKRAYDFSGLRALRFLIRFMKERQIDILQTYFLHADILGTIAAKWAGVRTIITTRRDEGFWRSKRQLSLNRFFNRYAKIVLANSKAVREAVRRTEHLSSKRIHVICNGVDLEKFRVSNEMRTKMRKSLNLSDQEWAIGMIANMNHLVKGHRYLIKVFSFLKKEVQQVKLFLVGDGQLKSSLERYATHCGITSSVIFLGSRHDIPELLNAMDIICAPSLSEGFSNTILEAMAAGKPVIATNVGGNPEMISYGETGFLVQPQNPEAIAQKLEVLVKDQKRAKQMGEAGRKHVEKEFSIEKMAREYEEFYEELKQSSLRGNEHTAAEAISDTGLLRRPIRIMQLIWSLDLGGAEQVVMNLVQGLDRGRFQPIVCCLNEKGRYAEQIEALGIKVIALHKKPKFDFAIVPKLMRVMKEEKIDLVHTHLFTSNLWGRIAAFLARVPVVSTEHNIDIWKKKYHFFLDRLLYRTNRRIVFVSEKVKDFYEKRLVNFNGKARVLYNGIDTKRFHPAKNSSVLRKQFGISGDAKVVGIVGRLVPQKAHIEFLEAIKYLQQKKKNVMGLIVGDGPLKEELEKRVRDFEISDRIIFTDFSTNMPELYHVMDVFVLCSLREGFPMTILEAMASGIPVVSTNVGGVPESICDRESGLLVAPGDSLGLAEAIKIVLEEKALREKIVQNARKHVETTFNLEHMVKEHEKLYEEVLAK